MIYTTRNGLNICHQGYVIIEEMEHFVLNGFVACNSSLNGRVWNTTKRVYECLRCKEIKKGYYPNVQLELFE